MLIASRNPHKIVKIKEIVDGLGTAVTLKDAGLAYEFKEDGKTPMEIAQKKAEFYSKKFKGIAIATDGGVEIPALKDWNPCLTKRFGGERMTDFERMDLLLRKTAHLKGAERTVYWNECVSIAENGKTLFSFQAAGDTGLLQTSYDPKKYREGIWVCSLWHYPQFGKNFFDLTPQELESSAETSWARICKEVRKFLSVMH